MFQVRMFQVHFRTLFEGEKNSFADLNREISEAETILSDQAEQIDDRRNVSPTLDVILNPGLGLGLRLRVESLRISRGTRWITCFKLKVK